MTYYKNFDGGYSKVLEQELHICEVCNRED